MHSTKPKLCKVVNNRVKVYWEEEGYRNNPGTRGTEFCEVGRSVNPEIELRTKKHAWSGFTINIAEDHSRHLTQP